MKKRTTGWNLIYQPRFASLVSLTAGILISLFKFTGYYITGSNAILSDALESIINVLAAALAVYSIGRSRSRDGSGRGYLYGEGKMEYISAGFEGGLVGLAGLTILYQSIPLLFQDHHVHRLDEGLFLVLVAGLGNAALGLFLVRAGRRSHSEALVADGQHVLTDVYSSLGLLVGLAVVYWTGYPWLDPLLAVFMALWILYSGLRILGSSFSRLMDRARPELIQQVALIMERNRLPELIHPHRLRLRESGERLLIDFHMIMPRYLTVDQAHDVEVQYSKSIEGELGRPIDLLMHSDPCIPENCALCDMPKCRIRKHPLSRREVWSEDLLLEDIHHPFMD